MNVTLFYALVALLQGSHVRAAPTTSSAASATTTAEPDCSASLVAELCDYKEPGAEFAIASSGKAHCWDYCDSHEPCNFVIFVAGNPYTGTGTCWLYPGEEYDESAGSTDGCSSPYLSVYDKPTCRATGTATATSDACTATASPSAVASVCGYPSPDDDCFYSCSASSSAGNCLSQCVDDDSCNYVVFNPQNPSNTPYASGSCWMYTNGTYSAEDAGTCEGEPEQYVYENPCPKPSPSTSSSTSSATKSSAPESTTGSGKDSEADAATDDGDDEGAASPRPSFSVIGLVVAGLAMML
jgi:hypothetical protein